MATSNRVLTGNSIASPNWQSPRFYALDFDVCPPSVANLPFSITLDGTTKTPSWRYNLRHATVASMPAWGYGEALSINGTGTYPIPDSGSPLHGPDDGSCWFLGARHYTASGSGVYDVATEDVVAEILFAAAANCALFSKSNESGARYGYLCGLDSSLNVAMSLWSNGSYVTCSTGPLVLGDIYHAIWIWKRSSGGQLYLNGIASGSAGGALAASITNSTTFLFGSRAGQVEPYSSKIYYGAMWTGASWLSNYRQDAWVRERFAQLAAAKASVAAGSSVPSVCTRSTGGYLDKIEADGTSRLYAVGTNWPRVCSRKEKRTNLALQSHTLATSPWTTNGCTVPTTSVLCPDGVTRTTCTIKEDGTNAAHSLQQILTSPVGFYQGNMSCWLKAANRTWAWINLYDGSHDIMHYAYLNLATGALGTVSGADARLKEYANGWWRLSVRSTGGQHSSSTMYLWIGAATGDLQAGYQGATQDSIYVFGVQLERNTLWPTDYIASTTVAANAYGPGIVRGYLGEPATPNYVKNSHAFNVADEGAGGWGKYGVSVPTTSVVCPDRLTRTTCMIHEDGANSTHGGLAQRLQAVPESANYISSIYARARGRSWVQLRCSDGRYYGNYDLTNGVVGWSYAPVGIGMIPLWDGWWRIWVSGAGAAYEVWWVRPMPYDYNGDAGSLTWQGLDQDSIEIFGYQVEPAGCGFPTSYWPNGSSSTSRSADALHYKLDDGSGAPSGGEFGCEVLTPNQTSVAARVILSCDDNSANNIAVLQHAAATNPPRFDVRSGGGSGDSVAGSTNTLDGAVHKIAGRYKTNLAQLYVDGTKEGTDDTSVTLPAGISKLRIGTYSGDSAGFNGLISKVRID